MRDRFWSRLPTVAGAALTLVSIACTGGPAGVDCDQSGSPSAQVGGGSDSVGFVALQSGDPMTVVLGPQGLYMVTPSVRVQNMAGGQAGRVGDSDDPRVEFQLYQGSTNIGGSAREYLGLTSTADGSEVLGVFTPFTVDISTYINQTITVKVDVVDACGNHATGSLDVVAQQ